MQKEGVRSEDRRVPLLKLGYTERRRQGSKMRKNNESRAKSTRKPLREVSNGVKSSSIPNTKPKSNTPPAPQNEQHDDSLDRLLLVHSDLSSLIHQVSLSFSPT